MVIIDSSVWILALRRKFHPRMKALVGDLLDLEEVGINGLIMLEILGGCRSDPEKSRLDELLSALVYCEAEKSLWEAAAALAMTLKRKGVSVPNTDIFIAATAMRHEAVLVHADSHFDLIARSVGLRVQSLTQDI